MELLTAVDDAKLPGAQDFVGDDLVEFSNVARPVAPRRDEHDVLFRHCGTKNTTKHNYRSRSQTKQNMTLRD